MNLLIISNDVTSTQHLKETLIKNFEEMIIIFTNMDINKAIKIAQEKDIDLIILDFHLENKKEITVAKLLQHTKKTQNIPIIFITSSSYTDFQKAGFTLGSVDYIEKPMDINLFINRISLYLTILNQNKLLLYINNQLKNNLKTQKSKNFFQEKMLIHQSKTSVLGEMIGAIAHQWRQPLNIIASSMLNLETKLEVGILDKEEIRRISNKINTTVQELSLTIDNFRNMFLFSNQKMEIDLIQLINSCIEFVNKQFISHGITINFHYSIDTTCNMHCYNNELKQVILNLLTNSKDAIDKNQEFFLQTNQTRKITIELEQIQDKVTLKLFDNGGGINPEILSKVFNPYFTTKFQNQGTGVGLYLCKIIVEQFHNGSISVFNIENGCCFQIEFTLED